MAKKVSELPAASTLTGTEEIPVVQGGVSKRTTSQDIANLNAGGVGTVESVSGDGVDNTDPNNPVLTFPNASEVDFTPAGNISAATVQAALQELDTEKQAVLGFTPENTTNKATDLTSPDNTKYPTTQAVATAISSAVTGLWDDRGNYDASGNVFPSSGGSGTAGAILKGDIWTISVAGTLGGTSVSPGDTVRALVDTPGSTSGNWAINAASSGSTTPNASQSVAGKVEIATTAEAKAGTTTGATGSELAIRPDVLREKLRANRTVTGASAITQDDSEGLIYFNSGSNVNFTIDQLLIDSYAVFKNIGAGIITFVNGTGVTYSGPNVLRPGESGSIVYRSATAPIIDTNTTKTRTDETTNFSLTSDDDETIIITNPSSNITCTVPTMSADAYVQIYNKGTANVLFSAGSGATLLNSLVLLPNSGCVVYWDTATNIMLISGNAVTWASVSSKPTTIEGFGIVDGVRKVDFNFTQQGNGAGSETTLYSFSVTGGTLSSDGDSLSVVAAGTFANTANNKRIRLKFGATTVFDSTALAITTAADWMLISTIIRSSATSQKIITELKTSSSVLVSTVDYNTSSETLASASTLALTGEASGASDVVKEFIKVMKQGH
jgi:hypothetical protein